MSAFAVFKLLYYFVGKVDTNVLQTGFMSTSERFAPPRDITIEETDVSNPGTVILNIAMFTFSRELRLWEWTAYYTKTCYGCIWYRG